MKQAILMTAYRDLLSIRRILERFDDGFSFFIHVDRKTASAEKAAFRDLCRAYPNVRVVDDAYRVNWGGINHLRAILLLAESALESGAGYFHLITGQDYPIRTLSEFGKLDAAKNHIEYFPLPSTVWASDGGGLDRIRYYRLHDVFDAKKRPQAILIRVLYELQKRLGVKRRLPKGLTFYGGSTYWSLSRECLQYVVDHTYEHPDFLKMFEHTFCPEEIYFQTVIMNSLFAGTVVNNNLRYILWAERHGSFPAILDGSDFEDVMNSDKMFARKISDAYSLDLIHRINNYAGGVCGD